MEKNEKDLFYQKLQPYFEQGLLREVVSNEHFAILSVGDRVYVACPYIMLDNMPYGIYLKENGLRLVCNDNAMIYSMSLDLLKNINKYQKLLFVFSEDRINFWKKWIAENKNVNKMNYEFEEELNSKIKSSKKR